MKIVDPDKRYYDFKEECRQRTQQNDLWSELLNKATAAKENPTDKHEQTNNEEKDEH